MLSYKSPFHSVILCLMNTMCFGSFKSGSVCPHALEAFCSSKKDAPLWEWYTSRIFTPQPSSNIFMVNSKQNVAPLWEWYTSRSSPRSHDSIFIQHLHDGKFTGNKIFTKILFYGPCLSRGRAPPKFHDYMNSFCLCYFFFSDTTLSCLLIYSQSLLFSGPFVPLHRWQCFGYKQGLVWVLKRLNLEKTCFLITIQAKFDALMVEKWGNIEIR